MTTTENLIAQVTKNSNIIIGTESVNKDGLKYRYDRIILKYKHTAYWLKLLFEAAAEENNAKYKTHFFYGDYSIAFDRAVMKGERDGKITMSKLILL
jgi:hypothetical protein